MEREEGYWEPIEYVLAQMEPSYVAIYKDDPAYQEYARAEARYRSLKGELADKMPQRSAQYQAFERKWEEHLAAEYGHCVYFDYSNDTDLKKAEQHDADLRCYQRERAELLEQLCAPPILIHEGWKGERPEWEVNSLESLELYLVAKLNTLSSALAVGANDNAFVDIMVETARDAISNAYLVFRQLGLADRPTRLNDLSASELGRKGNRIAATKT